MAHFYQFLTNVVPAGLPANTTCTLSFWYRSDGRGTLNVYLNAGFKAVLPLGSGSGTSARATPGSSNSVAATLPPLPPLFRSEVQPETLTGPADNFGQREPWTKLHNAGVSPVSLAGCYLANQFSNLLQWAFPAEAAIQPGQYLLVWADNEPGQNSPSRPDLHVSFALRQAGEAIGLSAPDGMAIDTVVVGPQTDNVSQGRYPDGGPALYFMPTPTPRAPNLIRLPPQPPDWWACAWKPRAG